MPAPVWQTAAALRCGCNPTRIQKTLPRVQHLLQRSTQFQEALVASFGSGVMLFDESPRRFASASACELSIEHATVLRLAFGAGAAHSAAALLRLQYESVLRAAWLLHAASVEEVALPVPPPAATMLAQLAAKAPAALVQGLLRLKSISGTAEAADLVRHSNGLLHLAYRLIATLTGKKDLVEGTERVREAFTDCLPPA